MRSLFTFLSITGLIFQIQAQSTYSCGDSACAVAASATTNVDYSREFAASQAINFRTTAANKSVLQDFQAARISINGSSKIYNSRYNAITNEIEIKGDDNKVYNLRKLDNVTVKFKTSNDTYKSVVYKNVYGQDMVDYFLIPDAKNELLLKQSSFTYVKAKPAKTGYDRSKPAYYKENVKYFFVDHNSNLVALSTNKKDVKSLYASKSDLVWNYIRKNKLKNKHTDDLAQLAVYLKLLQTKDLNDKGLASNK